jgi:hypothetical protein
MAKDVRNKTPNMQDKSKRTALQIFLDTSVQINPKHSKPFGCPVYVLESGLQGGSLVSSTNGNNVPKLAFTWDNPRNMLAA